MPDQLSNRSVLRQAWSAFRRSWTTLLLGTVVVLVASALIQWAAAYSFSEHGWDEVTGGGFVWSLGAIGGWIALLVMWHVWRAPVHAANRQIASAHDRVTAAVAERDTIMVERDVVVAERDQLKRQPVPSGHQNTMQALLLGFQGAMASRAEFHLGVNESEAFAAHYGDLVPVLDEWNLAVARVTTAPGRLHAWLATECSRLGLTPPDYDPAGICARLHRAVMELDPDGGVATLRWWSAPSPQGGAQLLLYLAGDSTQGILAEVATEPQATVKERAEAHLAPVDDLFLRVQNSNEAQEVVAARQALDPLGHVCNAKVMLHLSAPLFAVIDGCPFCKTHYEHRMGDG